MTKKHFIAFAREIADSGQSNLHKWLIAEVIIRVAQLDNPRFDRTRFITACGLSDSDA